MKFFESMKNAEKAAAAAPEAAAAADAQVQALQAGLTPDSFDPNDPGFAPVEGITLEEYARLTKLSTKQGLPDEAALDAFMVSQGVPAGRWSAISAEWVKRMGTNRAVTNQFGILYANS